MSFKPTNKFIHILVRKEEEEEQPKLPGLYIDYTATHEAFYSESPYAVAEILSPPSDGILGLTKGMEIILHSHLIEEINLGERTYQIAPESAVIGIFA